MASSSDERTPVELLAEEFLTRHKRGEHPTIAEYCNRHPEWSVEIREIFEALLMVEDLRPSSEDESGTFGGDVRLEGKRLERVGDYRILREIGRGGMGVVYEAEQEALGRRVALKVLPGSNAGDAKARARFEREAKAAARMHHTNIVPVFDVGQDGGHIYYAMQMIHGQGLDLVIDDLRRLRDRSVAVSAKSSATRDRSLAASLMVGKFEHENLAAGADSDESSAAETPQDETAAFECRPPSSAVLPGQSDISTSQSNRRAYYRSVAEIGLQTASALAYAHSRGIVHRDIKPSNLLLDAAGVVWVTDFGLAKTGDAGVTHTGDIVGTIRYMSPERFRGHCDARADVYALGLTLYEMLTLKPAFASPDRLKLIEQIRQAEPTLPRSLDSRLPRDLETIVLKAIDKEARGRYQSADEMAADLQRFVADEPILARRASATEKVVRWCRRNPVVASLTAAVVLVTALGFGATFMQMRVSDENFRLAKLSAREAEENAERANKSAAEADAARRKTADAYAKLEKTTGDLNARVYASEVNTMEKAWEVGSMASVVESLNALRPKAGQLVDLRSWEFDFFNRAANSHIKVVNPDEAINADAAFSGDGSRLFSAAPPSVELQQKLGLGGLSQVLVVKAIDTGTGKPLKTFFLLPPGPAKDQKGGKGGGNARFDAFEDGLIPVGFQQQGDNQGKADPDKQPDPQKKDTPPKKGKSGKELPNAFQDMGPGMNFGGGPASTAWTVNRDGTRIAFVAGGKGSGLSKMGGGKGGGGGGGGGFPGGNGGMQVLDANSMFDLLAKGSETIEIENFAPLKTQMAKWAEENKITNGRLTRQQFVAFYESAMSGMQINTGPLAQGKGKAKDPDAAAVARFKVLDKNNDGFLDAEEMTAPALKAAWKQYDKDGNGKLDLEEFKLYYREQVVGVGGGGSPISNLPSFLNPTPININPFNPATKLFPTVLANNPNSSLSQLAQKWAMGSADIVGLFGSPQGAGAMLGVSRALAGLPGGKGFDINALTTASPAHLRIMDVATGNAVFTQELGNINRNVNEQLVISPDGKMVAWHHGATGEPLRIWTIGAAKEKEVKIDVKRLSASAGFKEPVTAAALYLAFSPDGTRLAATSRTFRRVAVWDTATGAIICSVSLNGTVNTPPTFSPDGKRLAVFLNQKAGTPFDPPSTPFITLLDAENGEEWGQILLPGLGSSRGIPQLRFSRDSKLLAGFVALSNSSLFGINDETVISIWNVDSCELTRTLRGHLEAIVDVAPLGAGERQRFVSASTDGTIKHWDASGVDVLRPHTVEGFEEFNQTVANDQHTKIATFAKQSNFGGKGKASAKALRTGIGILDFKGQNLGVYPAHKGDIVEVVLSPEGKLAASVAFLQKNTGNGELHVWDTATFKLLFREDVPAYSSTPANFNKGALTSIVSKMAFSPNGKTLALATRANGKQFADIRIQVWIFDLSTRDKMEVTPEVEGTISTLQFSPDGHSLVATVTGKALIVWDASNGKVSWQLPISVGHTIGKVSFDIDGKRLAFATWLTGKGGKGGKEPPVADKDSSLHVLELAGGKELLKATLHVPPGPAGNSPLALSPDGKWLAVRSIPTGKTTVGTEIEIWNVDRKEKLAENVKGCVLVNQIAFSADSRRLFALDREQVKVFDVATKQRLLTLKGPQQLSTFALTPDGHRLILRGIEPPPGGTGLFLFSFTVLDGTPLQEGE